MLPFVETGKGCKLPEKRIDSGFRQAVFKGFALKMWCTVSELSEAASLRAHEKCTELKLKVLNHFPIADYIKHGNEYMEIHAYSLKTMNVSLYMVPKMKTKHCKAMRRLCVPLLLLFLL